MSATVDKTGCTPDTRRGYFIQTFSGKKFYPGDPQPEDIDIVDIAHALSQKCRYNGHCLGLVLVAQHSVHAEELAPPEYKLEALLHDASEYIMSDLPRPIKHMLPDYVSLDDGIQRVIARKFGIPEEMSPVVKEIDNILLATEKKFFMRPGTDWGPLPDPLPWTSFPLWSPEEAKHRFLDRFYALTEDIAA